MGRIPTIYKMSGLRKTINWFEKIQTGAKIKPPTRSGESTRRTRQPRVEQKKDDSIWGVDETNSASTSRTEER